MSLFALVGCEASVRSTALTSASLPRSPCDPKSVEVLSSGPPTRPHVDVAVMEVSPGFTEHATSTLLGRLRESAGAMGCDAVFLNQVDTHLTHDGAATTLMATCVVYTAPL